MSLLFGLLIPALTILTPMIILIMIWKKKGKMERAEFALVILGCFLLGLIVPMLATFLSAYGLAYPFGPDDPTCATGAAVFVFFGYLVNIIGVPITGIVLFPPKRIKLERLQQPKRTANIMIKQ